MTNKTVTLAYKGFDRALSCRGHQFEIGKTYTVSGQIKVCQNGFHACEHPLNCFEYYAPSESRYAAVTLSGKLDRHDADTKVVAAKITIEAELDLPELIARAAEWVFDHSIPEDSAQATGRQGAASAAGDRGAASATGRQGAASAAGDRGAASAAGDRGAASATGRQGAASATGRQGAASATGDRGAASATGYRSAASATGYRSAASATGNWSAASATGYRSAASATGDRGAASATGDQGAAMASGYMGSVNGKTGNALFLTERDDNYEIIAVWAGIVGKDGIEEDAFYRLQDGKPVKVIDS